MLFDPLLYERLLLAHLLSDFTFQTDWVFRIKIQTRYGVILHGFISFLTPFIVLMPYTSRANVTALLVLTGWHIFQDKLKIFYGHTEKRSMKLFYFWMDQGMHFLSLLIFALVIGPLPDNYTLNVSPTLISGLCTFILLGWTYNVLLIYFRNTVPRQLTRVVGIVERGGLFFGMAYGGILYALALVGMIPRVITWMSGNRELERRDLYWGLGMAALLAIGFRIAFRLA